MQPIHVIGGGLAGSEAAWQIASRGVPVVLHEMRPERATAVHKTDGLAELVCSNSFRSDDREHNAVGLLHEEMRRLGSLVMRAADANQVPAGGALAVDRDGFSQAVTTALANHPLVEISRGEIAGLPPAEWDSVIVATGPLTSPALADAIAALTGEAALAFFDAIAPIVHRDSIDMDVAWFQSRYDAAGPGGSGADYINCPLDRGQYEAFLDALLAGDRVSFHDWEKAPYFDGCLPIEVMAERGRDTLRWGPMKPVGLTNPHRPQEKPHAVVQLRQDNRLGTLFNIVGFQTKLKHAEQVRVFRMIPGLERAEFARLGGLHRNTFLNSPKLLDGTLAARRAAAPALRRPDHRLRRLCRVRRHRPPGRPLRGGRAAWRGLRRAAADHGARRIARPHHRRAHRDDRRRAALVPADERQFRAVPAARAIAEPQPPTARGCAAPRRRSPSGARSPRGRSPISTPGAAACRWRRPASLSFPARPNPGRNKSGRGEPVYHGSDSRKPR